MFCMTKPYLLQVNLSPNLSSTRHQRLAGLFSNVISDLVRLVGFGPGKLHCSLTNMLRSGPGTLTGQLLSYKKYGLHLTSHISASMSHLHKVYVITVAPQPST